LDIGNLGIGDYGEVCTSRIYIPASYDARAQTIAEFRSHKPVAGIQLEYSLAQLDIESEFVPLCTEYGIGIMA
jgi:aryl-alcohol dehydrogenase-like predicted oxidoreductase